MEVRRGALALHATRGPRLPRFTRELPLAIEEGAPFNTMTPWITYTIIAINIFIYVITSWRAGFIASTNDWIVRLGFVPLYMLLEPVSAYKIFTAMFTHANIFHILFNMYFLYLFGRAVERTLGHTRYLVLYILSGIFAALFHTVFMFIQDPNGLAIPSVGASGAISGILGAYMMLYPGTRLVACFLLLFFPVCFELLAVYYLLFWFMIQVLEGYLSVTSTVAFFAHAGGFIAGIALLPLLVDRTRLAIMRMYASARRLFGIIVFIPEFYRRRGLSPTSKTILLALISMLLVGSTAAFIFSTTVDVKFAGYNVEWRSTGPIHRDVAFLGIAKARGTIVPLLEATETIEARVLINTLADSGLLYNPNLAGKQIVLAAPQLRESAIVVDITQFHRLKVMIRPYYFEGAYNTEGFLTNGYVEASLMAINTRENIAARLTLIALRSPQFLVESISLLSLVATLTSIYVVAYRDEEYVITPE
ncbi:hypothetical protein Pyrde_0148 [Pyrodictium delaneyi]|uniref:Peptidase S54 rhomboid domain-containing protein n=1 Tax=Pyrodictium delaneyi TaxID=1273541 RepID=A0A0P0N1P2_9CREN|nr:rhomboid family intramembrane serine protease [Pyrodictium delaneyi]ALL00198.1 hypothetical protein Pyrde_0148 [Pyrodictium delaneyi]OWJ54283.1 hypothetical protein Pdsh_07290 [Pyrodictium delaneyi]